MGQPSQFANTKAWPQIFTEPHTASTLSSAFNVSAGFATMVCQIIFGAHKCLFPWPYISVHACAFVCATPIATALLSQLYVSIESELSMSITWMISCFYIPIPLVSTSTFLPQLFILQLVSLKDAFTLLIWAEAERDKGSLVTRSLSADTKQSWLQWRVLVTLISARCKSFCTFNCRL